MQALNGQIEVDSVEAQEASVQPWDVKLRQVQSGSFRGKLEFALIDDIMIYRDNWSRRTVTSGALPEDYFAICSGSQANNGIDWCGEAANPQNLAIAAPGTEVDFIIPPESPTWWYCCPLATSRHSVARTTPWRESITMPAPALRGGG